MPFNYDYNLIVIGAGSGGLVSALIAAATGAKVALIEAAEMGGDCLNTGCVPSKALIKAAKIAHDIRHSDQYGIRSAAPEIDFAAVMQTVHKKIQAIAPHDSIERFTELGVDCFQAQAFIEDKHHVRAGDLTLSCKNIIIATGARAFIPDIDGLASINYLSSDNLWELTERPETLLIIGAGPIGCEMAQAFQRLGSHVVLTDKNSRLLKIEDEEVSELIQQQFKTEGIEVKCQHQLLRFETHNDRHYAVFLTDNKEINLGFDKVLFALGRQANITGFGLEELGIKLNEQQRIQADPFLRTNISNIFVCGDVTGPFLFTHAASHQAWYATVNALFAPFKKFSVNYDNMAWCTFVDPQVARVGINEQEAKHKNIPYYTTYYDIADLDRAICDGKNQGFVKVLTRPKSDTILGVTIVAEQAGELIAEYILAKTHKLGLNKMLATLHIYPTWSEANKFAASEWRKQHIPAFLMPLLKKIHQLRRKVFL